MNDGFAFVAQAQVIFELGVVAMIVVMLSYGCSEPRSFRRRKKEPEFGLWEKLVAIVVLLWCNK
jgi:hypothetical protein